jgi:hypothetical protein
MKLKTAVQLVCVAIDNGNFDEAEFLLNKYRRQFGNRHFTYSIRLLIANGIWSQEMDNEVHMQNRFL